jgi:beta-galactosidase
VAAVKSAARLGHRGPVPAGVTGKLPYWGIGWYRKHFDVPESDKGRHVFLNIGGAMSYSMVWIDGHFAGGWPCGYRSACAGTMKAKSGGLAPAEIALKSR